MIGNLIGLAGSGGLPASFPSGICSGQIPSSMKWELLNNGKSRKGHGHQCSVVKRAGGGAQQGAALKRSAAPSRLPAQDDEADLPKAPSARTQYHTFPVVSAHVLLLEGSWLTRVALDLLSGPAASWSPHISLPHPMHLGRNHFFGDLWLPHILFCDNNDRLFPAPHLGQASIDFRNYAALSRPKKTGDKFVFNGNRIYNHSRFPHLF
jgi:hypothetical protein